MSADAILHAWHRSFDALIEQLEQSRLRQFLQMLVRRVLDRLDPGDPAQRDAALVLAVARSLLEPGWQAPRAVRDEVATMNRHIRAHLPANVTFLGVSTRIDFSQFQVRGHYTNSWLLQTYFRAMTWLGQAGFVL